MKIAIVIPAYNEEKRIAKTLEDYLSFFSARKKSREIKDFEICISINNTKDNTEKIVKLYMTKSKELSFIKIKEGGKGLAVRKGFEYFIKKDFDFIGFTDADDSVNAENFYKVLSSIKNGGGAIASRYLPASVMEPKHPPIRIITAWGFRTLVRMLFALRFRDTQCGGKIFRREVIRKILPKLTITQWAFDVDLLYNANKLGKIAEIPIHWKDSWGSKIDPIRSSVQMFFAIVQLRILNSPFKGSLRIINPFVNLIHKALK